ncbi:endonuclease IV [Entomoplasma ellychniae]|uniref:Probable endonuclease 4 n=1 Tax=Entomoplasma ellychniae TaxID=2114 RepID=A0A8E2UAI7_9MOLU|nr:deoxyribonuclease IV [Entomoplasma ellychniae]PPE04561.1 endonuclease IV [Entomoplasma ellychniae]
MKKPILGSHVGMSKSNKHGEYLIGSFNESLSYGANTFMIFSGPPQNTMRTDLDKLHIKEMKELMRNNNLDMKNLIVHAPYLINISNPVNQNTWDFGVDFLTKEILRCEGMGINILVLHPGARLKGDYQKALDALVKGLDAVAANQKNTIIALETMSGKGSEVGINLKDFAYVLSKVKEPDKVAVCLDTCHMHDAGYNLSDWDAVKQEIKQTVGKEKIRCFHLNDSQNPISAHKDRHENIGYGHIGFDTLLKILWDKEYIDVPKVLETPYHNDKPPYKEEIYNLLNKQHILKIKD